MGKAMEVTKLKTVWSEDPERCHSLYRMDGKTVRIRGVFGRHLIAEIFSFALLQWQIVAFTTEPVLEHTTEYIDQASAILLDEVRLILGDDL